MSHSRRQFLGSGAAAGVAAAFTGVGGLLPARFAFAAAPTDARFVFVLMRGALDGLAAVPPVGDPAYAALRGELALGVPGSGARAALPLDATFGLHPALAFMHRSYRAGELAVVQAVATPYRERSHFDGQDVLEGGALRPHDSTSGWLNRALAATPGAAVRQSGIALGANVPLVMRGPVEVASWSPTRIAVLDDDTLARLADLYAGDPVLSRRLADALSSDAIARAAQADAPPMEAARLETASTETTPIDTARAKPGGESLKKYANARYQETVRAAAGFLVRDDGPRIAVFDTSGWDTHANEGGAEGQLAQRLGALDAGLASLKEALGPKVWSRTVVLLATEFGRTAAINGTRGSDHGTGAAAFLLGGAVAGGRVVADWPGLASGQLYERRDLRPTTDLRAVVKGVLHDHLAIARSALDDSVYPGSAAVAPLRDLIRLSRA
jgi:uncharacterized protein (DUF1501 family)